jgi:hypothetical protein
MTELTGPHYIQPNEVPQKTELVNYHKIARFIFGAVKEEKTLHD